MKRWITWLFALICVLGLSGCSNRNLKFEIEDVSKLSIESGLTNERVTLTDDASIRKITDDIRALRFEKTASADGSDAYIYLLTWFDAADKQIASVTITNENGYQIRHDGNYYKVGADLCIDIGLIEEVFNNTLSSASN